MYIKITTAVDSNDGRTYADKWVIVTNNPKVIPVEENQIVYHTRDIPKDFYVDHWKYYLNDLGELRKNFYRQLI